MRDALKTNEVFNPLCTTYAAFMTPTSELSADDDDVFAGDDMDIILNLD